MVSFQGSIGRVRQSEATQSIWVVVNMTVPVLVLWIIQHLKLRDPEGDHDFDNLFFWNISRRNWAASCVVGDSKSPRLGHKACKLGFQHALKAGLVRGPSSQPYQIWVFEPQLFLMALVLDPLGTLLPGGGHLPAELVSIVLHMTQCASELLPFFNCVLPFVFGPFSTHQLFSGSSLWLRH